MENTIWQGAIQIDEDIVVPRGVTLTVKKNTVVNIIPSDSTKTDPEFMSPLTEITVRGKLLVEGEPSDPVIFRVEQTGENIGPWGGIIIDGGSADLLSSTIQDAETGVWIIDGEVNIKDSTLTSNRYALVAQTRASKTSITGSTVTGNEYGLITLDGATIARRNTRVLGNKKLEFHDRPFDDPDIQLNNYTATVEGKPLELEDEVLRGNTVWDKHVIVTGQVRVPVESRLVILPGTVVEFRKKDTNGDGIGESGLMLQGVLIAKGSQEKPIIFKSAEKIGQKGDWDAINIINSDGVRNIIEYCQFEDAYRGLHFHFSNAMIQYSVFNNNFRGIQFQESTVELRDNYFYRNHSGIQARDSEIIFADNHVVQNVFGANFLRAHLTIQNNRFGNNLDFGLKVREGYPTVVRNIFHHNRFGLMFSDASYGVAKNNLLLENGETGLSIRTGENMEITGNFIQRNGLSGMSIRNSSAVIKGNHISDNGERGIGLISFLGPIEGNSILDNHLYAIAAEDGADVTAPRNWFGPADIEKVIFDKNDDPGRGSIHFTPLAEEAPEFTWPLATVPLNVKWRGKISVVNEVTVPAGASLAIDPGTSVSFGTDAGFHIHGRFTALGNVDQRITFTAQNLQKPGAWGEIRLENAADSQLSNCDIEYATWGVHSHFTTLDIIGCSFSNNGGGLRFRSGPLLIKSSLFRDNGIGIRSFRGKAEITGNSITRNKKGIFVRERGGGLMITRNNIFDNMDYNIWVGDFNTEDIPAVENWWGTDDPAATFFDARREPGIGTVLFEPALKEPLDISVGDDTIK